MFISKARLYAIVLLTLCLVVIPSATKAATSTLPFTRPLIQGSTGTDVTALQQILVTQGYLNTTPTGFFGAQTAAALAKFQTAHSIEALGGVGPQTRNLLNTLSGATAVVPPTSGSCTLTLTRSLSLGSSGSD